MSKFQSKEYENYVSNFFDNKSKNSSIEVSKRDSRFESKISALKIINLATLKLQSDLEGIVDNVLQLLTINIPSCKDDENLKAIVVILVSDFVVNNNVVIKDAYKTAEIIFDDQIKPYLEIAKTPDNNQDNREENSIEQMGDYSGYEYNQKLLSSISEEDESLALSLIDKANLKSLLSSRDEYGNTALLLSVLLDMGEVSAKILERYRVLTTKNDDNILSALKEVNAEGKTILHMAAENNNFKILRFLYEKGAEITSTDKEGWTVLHSAVAGLSEESEGWELISWLLDHGVDVNSKDNNGKTARDFLEEYSNEYAKKFEEILLKHQVVESVKNDDIENLGRLLENNDPLDFSDKYGTSLLHKAATLGKTKSIEYLVDQEGLDVNIKSEYGNTPLHLAVLNNDIDTIKTLLKKGASPNEVNDTGGTPMGFAAELGQSEIFKELMGYNTKIVELKPLFSKAAMGIINNNEDCWEVIKSLLNQGVKETDYSDAINLLGEEHWLHENKFTSLVEASESIS